MVIIALPVIRTSLTYLHPFLPAVACLSLGRAWLALSGRHPGQFG